MPKDNNPPIPRNRNDNRLVRKDKGRIIATMRAGILPPPEELEQYERLYPGTARILMETYEKQVNHRIDIETKVIESGIKNSRRGQIMAFILGLIAITGGIVLIALGKSAQGIAAVITALAALTGVYIGGNISKKKERIEKSRQNPE